MNIMRRLFLVSLFLISGLFFTCSLVSMSSQKKVQSIVFRREGFSCVPPVILTPEGVTLNSFFPFLKAKQEPSGGQAISRRAPSINGRLKGSLQQLTPENVTLNGNAGTRSVPAGTYGNFTANGSSVLIFGVANATEPAIYNLQGLTLNGGTQLQIVGPVTLTLRNGTNINGTIGNAANPQWLTLNVSNGGVTILTQAPQDTTAPVITIAEPVQGLITKTSSLWTCGCGQRRRTYRRISGSVQVCRGGSGRNHKFKYDYRFPNQSHLTTV